MIPRRSPLLDALKQSNIRDCPDDYSPSMTPSVGCILEYETYGGIRRIVAVKTVHEYGPNGRPSFLAHLVIGEDGGTCQTVSGQMWGYWSQIVRILYRDVEVRA